MGIKIGPLHVRRSVLIEAAPSRVWQEFETFERIRSWFDHGHRLHALEPKVAGAVDMSIEASEQHPGSEDGRAHFVGRVLVVEPERELSFETDFERPPSAAPTLWTFRLSPVLGSTLVELLHHGYERHGSSAADLLQDLEHAWDMKHLDALRSAIEG